MARAPKHTLDYFSHDVTQGKTLFTLQQEYGNDGYAFWYKLLELLGAESGQVFDCRQAPAWRYLLATMQVDELTATSILGLLAELEAIDAELWADGIIWCQKFVDRHADIYKKRKLSQPQRPTLAATGELHIPLEEEPDPEERNEYIAESFKQFWEAYPKARRVKKPLTMQRWRALKPTPELVARIMDCLAACKRSKDWQKEGGKYIPHSSTWLNNKRWEDECHTPSTPENDDLDFLK